MGRRLLISLAMVIAASSVARGQDWALKMFQTTSYDFGSVPNGAKAEYEFVFKNTYMEDVHVADVRASCGCTTPSIKNPTVKTYGEGAIVAKYNTDRFYGPKSATLTVTFDRPFFAQVQLQVRGNIRTDMLVNPTSVNFGTVDQGAAADQAIAIRYVGRNDWQINGVKTGNPYMTTTVREAGRANGVVDYHVFVRLDPKAPPGYLNDHLILQTNDWTSRETPIAVHGLVQAGITVSPASLFMGVVKPGEKVTKPLVVKGSKPFRILSITADGQGLQFDTSAETEPKTVHMIPVTMVAGEEPGKVTKTIRIETDLGEKGSVLSAAYAEVASKQGPE